MVTSVIRIIFIYFWIILSIRLMGKRQIGQLQPSELVVTLLLSEIAAQPIEHSDVPLVVPTVCITLLVIFEILFSYVVLKSSFFRRISQGNPIYVIKEGKILVNEMRKLRFTVEDLMEALRQKDVFDISEVEYAVVETNGSLSVLKNIRSRPATIQDLKIKVKDNGIPCVIISDGKVVESNFKYCNMNEKKLQNILLLEKKNVNDIMIMTVDKGGNRIIVDKE